MKSHHKWVLVLVAIGLLGTGALFLGNLPAQGGGPTSIYLDLVQPVPRSANIPPDCSTWHELFPTFCATHHQVGYDDADGDGQISPCDVINLDGTDYHITWVGPTYFLTCLPTQEDVVYEPTDPTGGDPRCEVWHEIFPNFSNQVHVESWVDGDGDGLLSPCDIVDWMGVDYHLDRIGLNIIIEPGPTAIENDTWGKIKSLFRGR